MKHKYLILGTKTANRDYFTLIEHKFIFWKKCHAVLRASKAGATNKLIADYLGVSTGRVQQLKLYATNNIKNPMQKYFDNKYDLYYFSEQSK